MVGAAVVAEAAELERAETVRSLQDRIRGMQRTRLDSRALPTHPALEELLPGGALAAGRSYAVASSTTLALALAQAPSSSGSWVAVVGMADLGIQAAAELGLDLDRTVLVPHPGEQWLSVVSALIDVISIVLVRPPAHPNGGRPARVGAAAASRLASRLRQREAALVALGDWPGAVARLRIAESDWTGLGSGFGHLRGRMVTVASAAEAWAGRERSRRLWLPDAAGRLAAVDAPVASRRDRPCAPRQVVHPA